MQKKFLSNLFFLLTLNLIIKPLWILGIDRGVQNEVGAEEYGLYFALFNLSFLFQVILDMGITGFNNRSVARESNIIQTNFTNILVLKLVFSMLYIIITFGVAYTLGFGDKHWPMLILLCTNQVLGSMTLFMRSNISGMLHLRADSILSVLDKSIMIIGVGLLLWSNIVTQAFQIEWLVYGQTIAYLITLVISSILIFHYSKKIELNISFKTIRVIVMQSYPYATLFLFMALYYRIDGVMIERLAGKEGQQEAGFYAQGFRLLDACNMLGYLFSTLLLPILSKLIKEQKPVNSLIRLSLSSIVVMASVTAITSYVFRQEIMDLLYIESSSYIADIFGVLILSLSLTSVTYILGTLLTANGNLKQLNTMAIMGVFVNICLNYLLIPEYKAYGAAIATISTQCLITVFHIVVVKFTFSFKVTLKQITKYVAFIISLITSCYLSSHLPIAWMMKFAFSVISGVLLAFLLQLLNVSGLLSVIRVRND